MKDASNLPTGTGRMLITTAFLSAAWTLGAARAGAECAPDTTIPNPAPAILDLFGSSVAISGNLAVIGAPQADPGGATDAGAAHVFNAMSGALITTLNNPDATSNDTFGKSVAISGNVAVVGAPGDDPGGATDAGTAHVFNATTGALITTLNSPDPAAFDNFGSSVAIAGELVVVGAIAGDSDGVMNSGIAYVFDATTGALVSTLSNPTPATLDLFGSSVAISGNVVVVGAPADDPEFLENAGTSYVFNATTGGLISTLSDPAPVDEEKFGHSVGISGNLVVVGTPSDDPGLGSNVGTCFVFNATTGALVATLNNPARIVKILPYLAEKQNSLNLQRLCEGGFCGVEAVGGRLQDRRYRPDLHRAG